MDTEQSITVSISSSHLSPRCSDNNWGVMLKSTESTQTSWLFILPLYSINIHNSEKRKSKKDRMHSSTSNYK